MGAGLGTRFGKHTEFIPKGFIEVKGKPMVVSSVELLISCGVERIIIGTGYRKECYEELAKSYSRITTCFSPKFAETNSMYTLYNTRSEIGNDDFLLLESDIIYERRALEVLLESEEADLMLATPVNKFQDMYYVEYDAEKRLTNCSVNKNELNPLGEMVGIHKLSNEFYQLMCGDFERKLNDNPKLGYEFEILNIAQTQRPIKVINVSGLKWYEIDDESDLEYAEKNIDL
jgi:2-aminoethylphosphonate-pyruvate transaminase